MSRPVHNPGLVQSPRITVVDPPRSTYVHIPFCRRRCFYCDFPIYVVGDRGLQNRNRQPVRSITTYLAALHREIRRTPVQNDRPLETVFFGGGTPSLLTGEQLAGILQALARRFGLAHDAEISMEIDPGTFDRTGLYAYQQAGINRFSFGVQAFQADLLSAAGRAHTVADIATSITLLRELGIVNYSFDLIAGLPRQTMIQWRDSLTQAIAAAPVHISTYDLTIEAGTVFGKRYRPGDQPLPSDDVTADMYRLAHQLLTDAGYVHYEVSNYAKPGYQCRHNLTYWENRAFYGFGMGATSYLQGDRWMRPRQLQAYCQWTAEFSPDLQPVPLEPHDLLLDTLMVGLRLAAGISLPCLRQQFGDHLAKIACQSLLSVQNAGWVTAIDRSGKCHNPPSDWTCFDWTRIDRICLTVPEGFLLSNVVLVQLFDQLSV